MTGVEVRVATHDPSPGKEPDMSQTESVQGLEVRELTPVELNEIAVLFTQPLGVLLDTRTRQIVVENNRLVL